MGRPKKTSSEEMVALLEEYYESGGCGEPSGLKFSRLEAFAAGKGMNTKAYDFKRDERVRQRIRELEQEHELAMEQQAQTAYKTLDIEGFLKKCKTADDIVAALREMDAYWKKTCDHASSLLARDKQFMAEKSGYEKKISDLEKALLQEQKDSAEAVEKSRKLERENAYLRKMLRTCLYPSLANELLREKHMPVPENSSVKPEAMGALIDGRFPSAFEGVQEAAEKKPDWKEQLRNALESQVDRHGK